jgi:hypothetical protein
MAKRPTVSYAGLGLTETPAAEPEGQGRAPRPEPAVDSKPRTLKEAASAVVLYLHPAGHKDLKRYAVEEGVRVHDCLIEAVEQWARSKGLRAKIRAEVAKKPRD